MMRTSEPPSPAVDLEPLLSGDELRGPLLVGVTALALGLALVLWASWIILRDLLTGGA